jgi:hypothetical protein
MAQGRGKRRRESGDLIAGSECGDAKMAVEGFGAGLLARRLAALSAA